MKNDLLTFALKDYFLNKGKNLHVIQRYLRLKYRLIVDEKILQKRLQQLSM